MGKIQPSRIRWETVKLREAFYKREKSDYQLFKQINSALNNIETNAFCSVLLPKKLIPKKWKEYSTVWKYNLPKGWRLFYTITPPEKEGEVIVLSIILDWMSHKEYERLFKY